MKYRDAEMPRDSQPVPVYIVPAGGQVDEFTLADLWRVIIRHKMIVLSSLLVAIVVAVLYLTYQKSVYTAVAHLLPPRQQHVQELQIDYQGTDTLEIEMYTPESVYSLFLSNLRSTGVRREFFDSRNLVQHYTMDALDEDANVDRIFDERFDASLRVQTDRQDPSLVTVSFSDSDSAAAAQLLNDIVRYANKRTIEQLVSNVDAGIQAQVNQVRYQLASKLKLAEQRRLDTITSLKESLQIAKSLGIKHASIFPKMSDRAQAELAVNIADVPPYMRGVDALETEISVLETRKSDEPFVSGLRDLQERLAFLQGISLDTEKLSAVTVDAPARVPYRADSSRRSLVVLVALALGIITGIVAAFVAELVSRAGRQTSRQTD